MKQNEDTIITDTHFEKNVCTVDEYFYQFYEGQFSLFTKHNIKLYTFGDVLDRRKFVSYRIART